MITFALLVVLYFLPTIVASRRGHGIAGILVLNLLFGWTGIGWFAMLLWALLTPPRFAYVPVAYAYPGTQYGNWQRF
jgi:TM2 domain-containing membrane protein YozV